MRRESFFALMIGMWAITQIHVIGFIGISEVVIFLIAPFVLIKYWPVFKQDGMGTLFTLLFLTMGGCLVSAWYNDNGIIGTTKGFATIYGFFASITVIYPLLRKNPGNLGWIILGLALSGTISVFIFQPGTAYGSGYYDREALQEAVIGYALFWTNQISTWATLPIKVAYLKTPLAYSILVPFAISLYALISTSSGRSSFLVGMFGVTLLLLGGRSRAQLARIRQQFSVIAIIIIAAGLVFALGYKYLARSGALGEASKEKYERQVKERNRGEGLLGIIMGGRIEVFIGGYACLKNPIIGCGPKAEDKENIVGYFYDKYGTYEDVTSYYKTEQMRLAYGLGSRTIPAHSHLISFWLWFGIPGLVLWIYILGVMIKTLKNDMNAIPQWFGYFALVLPSVTLAIFISPFGNRVETALIVCACFIARNVNKGRVGLPIEMIKGMQRYG